jgi:hypothetical protein
MTRCSGETTNGTKTTKPQFVRFVQFVVGPKGAA